MLNHLNQPVTMSIFQLNLLQKSRFNLSIHRFLVQISRYFYCNIIPIFSHVNTFHNLPERPRVYIRFYKVTIAKLLAYLNVVVAIALNHLIATVDSHTAHCVNVLEPI